jgi:hypothetical protein
LQPSAVREEREEEEPAPVARASAVARLPSAAAAQVRAVPRRAPARPLAPEHPTSAAWSRSRQQVLDLADQRLRLERLRQEAVGLDAIGLLLVERLERAGQQQHRDVREPGVFFTKSQTS